MGKVTNETGKRYGRLTVIRRSDKATYRGASWLCRCDCGMKTVVASCHLRKGDTRSCGCLRVDVGRELLTTHGLYYERMSEYWTWNDMIRRCYSPKRKRYPDYGGRGIRVCKRWRESFANFFADMGPRPKRLTLERKNNDGNYTPKNCCWATRKQQVHNRRDLVATHRKLTREQAYFIRDAYNAGGVTQQQLADKFKVHVTNISMITRNKIWMPVPSRGVL